MAPRATRAATILIVAWALVAPIHAETPEGCSVEEGCVGDGGAKMLQRNVHHELREIRHRLEEDDAVLPQQEEFQTPGLEAEEEEGGLEEDSAEQDGQRSMALAGSRTGRGAWYPRRRRSDITFCGHNSDEINRVIAPPKPVQRLMSLMLGITWGVGFPNMTHQCKLLPMNPNAHYITFTLGSGLLQGAAAERAKLRTKRNGGETVTTTDKFKAAKAATTSHAFCIALRMCSYDPAKESQTWLKQWTFGFHHSEGILLYKKGPLELRFHGIAFSSGGELYVAKLGSPLWGYGDPSATNAPVTNLHWWFKISLKFVVDAKKAITADVKGTMGAYVEVNGEKDIAAFLENMVDGSQYGTWGLFALQYGQPRLLLKMLGTVQAKISVDLKKLFGPSGAKSDTPEGQAAAPAKLFKFSVNASMMRELQIEPGSFSDTYVAQYFSARAGFDLNELLKVSDFWQELLTDWVGSAGVYVYMANYFKLRLNGKIDAGFRIGGELSLNCGFLNKIPHEAAAAFPLVAEIKKVCGKKLTVNLDLVATQNKLDFEKTCLHVGAGEATQSFCLDQLPTCPHPVGIGGKCSLNTDCEGDEYGVLKRGYCKSQNFAKTTTFCTGRCEKLAGPGESCSASTTNTLNWAHAAENEKCEAHFQGAAPACLCGTCTDSVGKLADHSVCATDLNCQSGYCDKGGLANTMISQGCTGTCAPLLDLGQSCDFDAHCKSDMCSNGCRSLWNCNTNGKCVSCLDHGHCPWNQYCKDHACVARLANGHGCSLDRHCTSGRCSVGCRDLFACSVNGKCVQCLGHDDCSSSQYCMDGYCKNKLAIGWGCGLDRHCASGRCSKGCRSVFDCDFSGGSCVECLDNNHCSWNQYCKDGRCVNRLPNGWGCSLDRHCVSGHCSRGCRDLFTCSLDWKCVQCLDHNHCGSNQYCMDGQCKNKLALGHGCGLDRHCASGRCSRGCRSVFNCDFSGGSCVQCLDHYHCPHGQYCESGRCHHKISDFHASNKHWKCWSGKDICGYCGGQRRRVNMPRGWSCSVDGDCGWGTRCGSWWQNCWGCRCHCG